MSEPKPTDAMIDAAAEYLLTRMGYGQMYARQLAAGALAAAREADVLVPTVKNLQDRVARQAAQIRRVQDVLTQRNAEIARLRNRPEQSWAGSINSPYTR